MPSTTSTALSDFRPEFYLDAYNYAKSGHSDNAIGALLGVTHTTIANWRRDNPAFDAAITRGREGSNEARNGTFRDFVYQHLPEDLQDIWDRINLAEDGPNPYVRVTALLNNQGKDALQHLFLYALVDQGFNATAACKKLCISRMKFTRWLEDDPDFVTMIDAIREYKKDFFEGALVSKVAEGDTAAIIFANRTYNADRGYADVKHKKVESKHQHDHSHTHQGEVTHKIALRDLELPPGSRQQLLDAAQKQMGLKPGQFPALPAPGERK